jgi:hypothetical protein
MCRGAMYPAAPINAKFFMRLPAGKQYAYPLSTINEAASMKLHR